MGKKELSDEDGSIDEFVNKLNIIAENIEKKKDDDIRYSFQIELKDDGEYIGWVNCYCIDENYNYTNDSSKFALGIDIPPHKYRGMGYGYEVFQTVIKYFRSKGIEEIYTQTWSGNERMIALANKLGFKEVCRKKGQRILNGKKYDGLTFLYHQQL